jgi:hypothetical protein
LLQEQKAAARTKINQVKEKLRVDEENETFYKQLELEKWRL